MLRSASTVSSAHQVSSRSPEHGFTAPLAIVLVVAVVLRLVGLEGFPPPMLDEGGWPLSVRQWVEDGLVTFDFHTAPGYHVILGGAFEVGGASMITGRWFSAVLALLMLPLFWWTARRLSDPRTASWATVLWATCFPAIDIARRSLIEPIQMTWLLGLLAATTLTGASAGALVALMTAGLLLTKANAVVLLPAFALALWWDRAPVLHARQWQKLAGMVAGVALAGLTFLALYLSDPPTFVEGWEAIMKKPSLTSDSPVVRIGRFVLDPALMLSGADFVATQIPFLLAFGVVGALRAMRAREVVAAGAWVLLLFPFLLLQVLQSPQYFSLLYPALALSAAALLTDASRRDAQRFGWPALALALMLFDGLARSAGAMLTVRRTDLAAIDWLRANVGADERVITVPVLLMQLPTRGTSMFELEGPGYVPSPGQLARHDARWVVVDRDDWQVRLRRAGIDSAALADTLSSCCELVRADGYAWAYRVRARR